MNNYQCKKCGKGFLDGYRMNLEMADGIIMTVYLCPACHDKHSDKELYKLIIKKILH